MSNIFVRIGEQDCTARLLYPNGITNLNRSIRDANSFTPVGATCTVAISDFDYRLTDYLGIPRESSLGQWNFTPKPIAIHKGGELLFRGDVESVAEVVLADEENPDNKRIVKLNCIDETLALMRKLSTRRSNHRQGDVIGMYAYPPILSTFSQWRYLKLDSLMSFLSERNVNVDGRLQNIYLAGPILNFLVDRRVATSRGIGVTRINVSSPPSRYVVHEGFSAGELIVALSTLFLAEVFVRDNSLFFVSKQYGEYWNEWDIDEYTTLSASGNTSEVSWIEDLGTSGAWTASSAIETIFWQRWEGGLTGFPTKPQGAKSGISIVPPIYDSIPDDGIPDQYGNRPKHVSYSRAFVTERDGNTIVPCGWLHFSTIDMRKMATINHWLTHSNPIRIKTPGTHYHAYDRIRLKGQPGFRVINADISPQAGPYGESELLLEKL